MLPQPIFLILVISTAVAGSLKLQPAFRASAQQHSSSEPLSTWAKNVLSSMGDTLRHRASPDQSDACTWSKNMSPELAQRHGQRDDRVAEWIVKEGAYSWWKGTCEKRPRGKYAWQSCRRKPVRALSTMEMCTILNKRNLTSILFIGDSLTRLNAYTAAAMLDASPGHWDFVGGNPEKDSVGMRYTACNSVVRIGFLRNDLLDTNLTNGPCPRVGGYCLPWASPERFGAFDVVVVNSGAHYVDDVFYEQRMVEASDKMASLSRPNQRVIFRATIPGHSNCTEAAEPFKNLVEAELDVRANPWYDAARFKSHNGIARRAFEKNGFEYMDVYTPTVQRRDMHVGKSRTGHVDCLHYCLPGPSQLWVDFLMHLLDGGSTKSLP